MAAHGKINAVYYPSWRVYRGFTPASLNVDCITHVLYAFMRINEDGTLRHIDERADTIIPVDGEKGCLAALAKLKRQQPHLRTIISIGGGSGSAEFPAMAASHAAQKTFAREVKAFVDKWEFDGVDIDWEHPSNRSEAQDFLTLLETLRSTLPEPYLLTIALPCSPPILRNLPLREVAPLLNCINLMAYDFSGPWTKTSGHHAQLYPSAPTTAPSLPPRPAHSPPAIPPRPAHLFPSAPSQLPPPSSSHSPPPAPPPPSEKSISSTLPLLTSQSIPSSKIILGIPCYAQIFSSCRQPGDPVTDRKQCSTLEYRELSEVAVKNAKVCRVTGSASYVDKEKGFMSFDVPETVRMKAKFVKEKGLGGLMYWTAAGDKEEEEGLVRAGWKGLSC